MLHAGLLALADEPTPGPLTVDGGLMLWTVIIFVALLAILKRFAWPAILGAVEAREQALEQQLAEAERNRAEAAKLLEEHKRLVGEGKAPSRSRRSCCSARGARSRPSGTGPWPICGARRWISRSRRLPNSSASG